MFYLQLWFSASTFIAQEPTEFTFHWKTDTDTSPPTSAVQQYGLSTWPDWCSQSQPCVLLQNALWIPLRRHGKDFHIHCWFSQRRWENSTDHLMFPSLVVHMYRIEMDLQSVRACTWGRTALPHCTDRQVGCKTWISNSISQVLVQKFGLSKFLALISISSEHRVNKQFHTVGKDFSSVVR